MVTTATRADFDLHIQKSFSFSAFKESTLGFFSDDEDDQNDTLKQQNDTIINLTDENSFIEIALDDHKTNGDAKTTTSFAGTDHLRISFSSGFPSIPETARHSVIQISPSSSLRSSSVGTAGSIFPGSESFSLHERSRRRDQLPAFSPLVHTLLFSLDQNPSPAPEIDERDRNIDGDDHYYWKKNHHLQLAMVDNDVLNRKASNVTPARSNNGGNNNNNPSYGIMKLLMIKIFRAAKVRKLFSSLLTKSKGQVNYLCDPNKLQNDISYNTKRSRPYDSKETTQLEYYTNNHLEVGVCYDSFSVSNDTKKYSPRDKQRRRSVNHKPVRALDVNLGPVGGVLEALNASGRRRKTSSCPSSIKSSPIHQGLGDTFFAGENSIQAAIAHCKSSLGQSSEFRF